MISVNIATLKAKLSYYLSEVKKGHEVVVMDRSTPVARLRPIEQKQSMLVTKPATKDPKALKNMVFKPLKRPVTTDVVAMLREDRDRR